MKYIVIGGAGAMGAIVVRDLFEFTEATDEIVIADYNLEKAQDAVKKYSSPKMSAVFIDAKSVEQSSQVLKGAFVVVNCVQYQLNINVMEACLRAGAHYVDLGGLFHTTNKQLELHEHFKQKGLMAILGMGAAPGITNILSRVGADKLDRVTEIHTRVAGRDLSKYSFTPALPVSYSLQTILEEFSFEPAFFTKGKMTFVKPISGREVLNFPKPVGKVAPMHTIHSEVATLPYSFADKGVKEVSFKIAFDSEFLSHVCFLRDMGLASHDPVKIRDQEIVPIEFINKIAMQQKPSVVRGKVKQYEIVRAVVKGISKKKKVTYVLDCHTQGLPEWGFGTDVNTGCPPAIAAIMLAKKEIEIRPGTFPPEKVVVPEIFFAHLKKRKMKVLIQKKSGWGFRA